MTRRKRARRSDYTDGECAFSRKMRYRIRCYPVPAYALALGFGIKPATFYKWCRGVYPVSKSDGRLLKLCEVLMIRPEDAFVSYDQVGT